MLYEALRGEDPLDSTSQELPDSDSVSSSRLRVGVPEEYFGEGLSDEVRAALDQAKAVWEQLDVEFVPVNLYTRIMALRLIILLRQLRHLRTYRASMVSVTDNVQTTPGRLKRFMKKPAVEVSVKR